MPMKNIIDTIRDFIRLLKESIALSLEESDEYDDLYND